MFHLLLYCLWWISNSSDDIVEYYNGIHMTFNEINRLETCETNIIQLREEDYSKEIFTEYTEEELQIIDGDKITDFNIALVKILSTSNFEEINYTYVATPEDNTTTFSDCVETGLRNFINILIFNNNHLDITILSRLGAIQPLINYYVRYPNFTTLLTKIAREEWVILLGLYANEKIEFKEMREHGISFNIKSSIHNFKQLLENLFPLEQSYDIFKILIEKSDGLIEDINIRDDENEDENEDKNKINILIKNINLESQTFIIKCRHLNFKFNNIVKYNIDNFDLPNEEHQNIIKILLKTKELLPEKYLHQIYREMGSYINNIFYNSDDNELKLNILIIVLKSEIRIKIPEEFANYLISINFFIDKHKDLFKYLVIILNDLDFMLSIVSISSGIPELNKISYTANNELTEIKFSRDLTEDEIAMFKTISDGFMAYSNIETIDLSPFRNVKSIGNYFFDECANLETIDLSPFTNVKTIGNYFLDECISLEIIDISPLIKLETIGNYFLEKCTHLKIIKNSSALNIKSIGENFIDSCENLEEIESLQLEQLESIGDNFLSECSKLKKIDNISLINVKNIGEHFLSSCESLETINLSSLIHVETIGDCFLQNCKSLERIVLSSLINLKNISNYFMALCENLEEIEFGEDIKQIESIGNNCLTYSKIKTIDMSSFTNLKNIDGFFLSSCKSLETINLSSLIHVESIGDCFLQDCTSLKKIDLSSLINLKNISNYFLAACENLEEIEFGNDEKQIESIGDNFLTYSKIKIINMSSFTKLKNIGRYFLANSMDLITIYFEEFKIYNIGFGFLANCTNISHIHSREKVYNREFILNLTEISRRNV